MKRWNIYTRGILIIGTVLAVILAAGCEKKITAPELPPIKINALTILCNPLAPEPGEIAQLTTLVTGTSGTTTPKYHWIVEAGSLQVDEKPSVGWKVPDESGVYRVEMRVSLDKSADTLEKYIMVRNFEELNWDCYISGSERSVTSSFYPFETSGGIASISYGNDWYPGHPIWGYHVLINSGTEISCKTDFLIPEGDYLYGGNYFTINTDENQILGSMYMTASGYYRQQRMDVWLFPTNGNGSPVNVTVSDLSNESEKSRRNQHIYPYGSKDMDMVVWQQNTTGMKLDGTDDEFNIGFSNRSRWSSSWSEGQPPTFMTMTQSYYIKIQKIGGLWDTSRVYYKNIRPILTPQDDNVIYFVDSTGTLEPCLVPIVGGEPDTLQRRAIMVGLDHGIFWLEDVEVGEKTIFEWNPTSDLLGFIDKKNFLCFFDYQSETVRRLKNIGKVIEFAWSPDGSQLAVIHAFGVPDDPGASIVNLAGASRLIFLKERTSDELFGINWSPDPANPQVGFRVIRKGSDATQSYSAIVIYADLENKWYYATPDMRGWSMEPIIEDYRWLRVLFKSDLTGIYAPIPVANVPDKDVVIYHSFE